MRHTLTTRSGVTHMPQEDEANGSGMAAAEFLVDVRRLPVRRSPKDAAGGSRTPGFEAFRVPGTADEIGAKSWRMPTLPQVALCNSDNSLDVHENVLVPDR